MKQFEGEFQIVRILGKGSYGEVALARSRKTKQQYALKFYSLTQLSKINKLYSIKRAMKIIQKLQSPYIIKLYEYIYDNEKLLLRYEACPYGTLQEYIKTAKRRSDNINKELICQMVQILEYLHSVQVIHRDVKPSNLVFGKQGFLKLIDFDEALTFNKNLINEEEGMKIIKMKFSGTNQCINKKTSVEMKSMIENDHSRTRQQTYVGTPCYMPPEMKENRSYDEKGDLWSLGCIMFQLLAGETFYTQEDDDTSLTQSRKSERVSKLRFSSDSQEGIAGLIQKILSKDPNKRPNINQILEHSHLKIYRQNKQLRQKTKAQIIQELKERLIEKQQQDESQLELRFSPFFSGFQILSEIKVYAVVLKKGWYFYSPAILKSNNKSFTFSNQFQSNIEESISFNQVVDISEHQGEVIITSSNKKIRLKHIIGQMNQKLRENMKYVLSAFT